MIPGLNPIADTLYNLALVIPGQNRGYQPTNPAWSQAPPPLLFHYEGENIAELVSDITDHFVEDNTAIQDQIALRPEMVQVHGFIGELNDISPLPLSPLVQSVGELGLVSGFLPEISISAQHALNLAQQAYQSAANSVNSAVSAWSSLLSGPATVGSSGITPGAQGQNKQQVMFQQFYGYWRSRSLFTVQTPWAIYDNMAIQSLRAVQDESTRMITDFHVIFKKIRFASLNQTPNLALAGRASDQAASLLDQGTVNPGPGGQTLPEALQSVLGGN